MRGRPFPKGNIPHNKTPDFSFVCTECGKEFIRTLAYIEEVGIPKTCSRICHNRRISAINKTTGRLLGKNNGGWKGGISVGYYRRIFQDTLPKFCQRCNSETFLVVHHLDYNRQNNQPDNLLVLCRSCHAIEHNVIENITSSREIAESDL